MSNTLQGLNRHIASAGDLQGVVRSMKALAASSITQYERAVESLTDYYRTIELALAACFRESAAANGPQHSGPIGAVVFGSDQGLVGRFNEVLDEFAMQTLQGLPGKIKKIWAVGERLHGLMLDTGLTQKGVLSVPASAHAIAPFVGRLLIDIENAREKGEVEAVYLFHNQPLDAALYKPVCRQMLPLDHIWQGTIAKLPWPTKSLPEVIGEATTQIEAFIQEYFFVLLFKACAESLASENASRLAAMQRAEKNIKEILEKLSATYHRVRQESIDEELFEVTSGFDALVTSHRNGR
jgi:F-type H+-transporting ATPase subunit gamma